MRTIIAPALLSILAIVNSQSTLQVTTAEGTIEGYASPDGHHYSFHGIPYAMSKLGWNTYEPSTPSGEFPGLYHAYDSGVVCARPSPTGMVGIINCLLLNVFTKDVAASKPVLVWLNGEESNPTVSSQYSYNNLLDEDVVVVTLNYRLSVFGFLCLKTERHPGNAGLKDIILGLQWIQRNIAVFGGNPNNVILMGHGFAAAIVDIITLVPQSENLVHKAIAFSGSAVAPWAISHDPIGAAVTLNTETGGGLQSIDDVAVFLTYRTLSEINDALNKFTGDYRNNTYMFAPCIEDSSLEGALLTDSPLNLYKSGSQRRDIPYLAGYVTKEGTFRAEEAMNDEWLDHMQVDFTQFLPVDLDFGENVVEPTEEIRNFYFSGPINMTSIDAYLDYIGDTMAVVPIIRGLRERVETSNSNAWLLEFGYLGTNNSDWNLEEIPLTGARHGSILNYIFNFDLLHEIDRNVADNIVKRITTFARTGTPTHASNDWSPFTTQSNSYLSMSGNGETGSFLQHIRSNPQADTMTFWDRIYDAYYNAPSSAGRLIGLLSVTLLSCLLVVMS